MFFIGIFIRLIKIKNVFWMSLALIMKNDTFMNIQVYNIFETSHIHLNAVYIFSCACKHFADILTRDFPQNTIRHNYWFIREQEFKSLFYDFKQNNIINSISLRLLYNN